MKQNFSKAMLLISVILMDLLAGTELDLFVPSFPDLQNYFHLTPFWVEALLSVNFIGYCLSLFFVGGWGDRYGRKPIILMGLMTFVVGSVLCVWSVSYPVILVGRFFQGVGMAAPVVLGFLIIADNYSLKRQQFLMSLMNGVTNTSVALAPVVGSYITLYFHWFGNFIALLFLGLFALCMTMFFVPAAQHSYRKEMSLSYRSLFQSGPLLLLIVNIVAMAIPYWIFVGMSPLLYIRDLGVSLSHFGYYQGVLAFVFAIGSVVFGFMIERREQKTWLRVASKIYIVGLLSVVLVTVINSMDPFFITMAFLPFIVSQIIPSNILYPICLNFIPEAKGRISSVLQGARFIFSAVSLEIAGYFYQGTFRNIGIIVSVFILVAIVTHVRVIRDVGGGH